MAKKNPVLGDAAIGEPVVTEPIVSAPVEAEPAAEHSAVSTIEVDAGGDEWVVTAAGQRVRL